MAGTYPGRDGVIAYERNGDVWIRDPDSAEPAQLLVEDAGAPSWSPDGSKLAFERAAQGEQQVWISDITSGEATQLTTVDGLHAYEPTWLTKTTVVYRARSVDLSNPVAGSGHLFSQSISGGPAIDYRGPDPEGGSMAHINADGAGRVAFDEYYPVDTGDSGPPLGSRASILSGIFMASGNAKRTMVSTNGVAAFLPVWTPDRSGIAYTRRVVQSQCCDMNIYLTELGGSTRPLLPEPLSSGYYELAFSPQGDRLVFADAFAEQLFLVDVATGARSSLGAGEDPDWRPIPGVPNTVVGAKVKASGKQKQKLGAKPKIKAKLKASAKEAALVTATGKAFIPGKGKVVFKKKQGQLRAGKPKVLAMVPTNKAKAKKIAAAIAKYRNANKSQKKRLMVKAKVKVTFVDSEGAKVTRRITVKLI